jgi:hypothetical protein
MDLPSKPLPPTRLHLYKVELDRTVDLLDGAADKEDNRNDINGAELNELRAGGSSQAYVYADAVTVARRSEPSRRRYIPIPLVLSWPYAACDPQPSYSCWLTALANLVACMHPVPGML